MKWLFFFFSGLICINAFSQIQRGKFTTTIKKANNVTIQNRQGGKVEITSANVIIIYNSTNGKEDPVAQVIVDSSIINQKFYVVSYKQEKEDSGLFVTTIEFGNTGGKSATDVNILVNFDKPFETSEWNTLTGGMSILEGYLNNKMGVFFSAGMMFPGKKCSLTVKSKEKLYASITGVDGTFN